MTVYFLNTYGLLIFNLDFNQLALLICTEEIANANEQHRTTILFESKPE